MANIKVRTKEAEPTTFLKKKHELDRVIKGLESGAEDAVKLLVDIVKDETLDVKFRATYAEKLLTHLASMVDQKNKDQINRMIAEIKVKPGGATKQLELDEEDDNSPPILDFSTVREF